MHHWAHINRQQLQRSVREQIIELNTEHQEDVDYTLVINVAESELISRDYPAEHRRKKKDVSNS